MQFEGSTLGSVAWGILGCWGKQVGIGQSIACDVNSKEALEMVLEEKKIPHTLPILEP